MRLSLDLKVGIANGILTPIDHHPLADSKNEVSKILLRTLNSD